MNVGRQEVYKVEITHASDPNETHEELVDLSRILHYVSPFELERFENEEFKLEQDAEAVVARADAEAVARKHIARNFRSETVAQGNQYEKDIDSGAVSNIRGRGRTLGRSRGRPRGRGSGRGRGATILAQQSRSDNIDHKLDLLGIEYSTPLSFGHTGTQIEIPETELEGEDVVNASTDEDEVALQPSPSIMRSAFVTNSALSVSPVALHHELMVNSSDMDQDNDETSSRFSAAHQLHFEDNERRNGIELGTTAKTSEDERHYKRMRLQNSRSSSPISRNIPHRHYRRSSTASGTIQVAPHPGVIQDCQENNDTEYEDEDSEAQEYVVEAIHEHYVENGRKFYLVKWEGFNDSYDWLPAEDLESAADLVAEYNREIRRKNKLATSSRHSKP